MTTEANETPRHATTGADTCRALTLGVVDQTVYAWNWSPPAKAANTAGVVAAVLVGHVGVALALAAAVAVVKVWSAYRVLALLTAEDR